MVGIRHAWGGAILLLLLFGLAILGRPAGLPPARWGSPAREASPGEPPAAEGPRELWGVQAGTEGRPLVSPGGHFAGLWAGAAGGPVLEVRTRSGQVVGELAVPGGAAVGLVAAPATEAGWLGLVAGDDGLRALGPGGGAVWERPLPGAVQAFLPLVTGAAVAVAAPPLETDPPGALPVQVLVVDPAGRQTAAHRLADGAVLHLAAGGPGPRLAAALYLPGPAGGGAVAVWDPGGAGWQWSPRREGEVLFRVAVGAGGAVAAISSRAVYSVSARGHLQWERPAPGRVRDVAVTRDGGVIVLGEHPWLPRTTVLLAYRPDGEVRWQRRLSGAARFLTLASGPADPDLPEQVVAVTARLALGLGPDAGLLWAEPAPAGGEWAAAAAAPAGDLLLLVATTGAARALELPGR